MSKVEVIFRGATWVSWEPPKESSTHVATKMQYGHWHRLKLAEVEYRGQLAILRSKSGMVGTVESRLISVIRQGPLE